MSKGLLKFIHSECFLAILADFLFSLRAWPVSKFLKVDRRKGLHLFSVHGRDGTDQMTTPQSRITACSIPFNSILFGPRVQLTRPWGKCQIDAASRNPKTDGSSVPIEMPYPHKSPSIQEIDPVRVGAFGHTNHRLWNECEDVIFQLDNRAGNCARLLRSCCRTGGIRTLQVGPSMTQKQVGGNTWALAFREQSTCNPYCKMFGGLSLGSLDQLT
jgi:hypothetical protein